MEHHFDKHFTLEQANALIPHVRRLFAEVQALLETSEAATSDFHYPPTGKPNGNGHHANGHSSSNGHGNGAGAAKQPADEASLTPSDYSGWSDEKRHEAAYRLLNALQGQGIVIQDVGRGLIDFPSLQDGHEVFLCYELSDGLSIQYFHELEAGFAGRRLITENDE